MTGRRYSEIMARGYFQATNHPYQIRFSGQLKKRGEVDSYTTFTLVPTQQVLAALKRFRNHPTISSLQDASISEINKLNTPINRLVKRHFQDSGLVPVLVSEAGVTIQNLRSIYGEIAVHFFCPPDIGVHRFIQQRLGHLISDPELAHSKNSGSTEHYFHYYLIDHQGQPLTTKGILRAKTNLVDSTPDQEVEVKQLELTTEVETERTTTAEPPSHQSLPNPTVHHSSGAITPSQLEHSDGTTSVESQPHLDRSEFLTHIATLILSDDYQSLLVGLMAATGLDAASLLKLLVFKQAAAPHLILYCHQLHPAHQPLQQLITLLPAADVLAALERLRCHREAIDFAHRRTGEEINTEVASSYKGRFFTIKKN